jgi:hypothetical protein
VVSTTMSLKGAGVLSFLFFFFGGDFCSLVF